MTLATPSLRHSGPLPGFGLTLGLSLAWLGLIVLLPLTALVWRAAGLGLDGWWQILGDERVLLALRLSFGTALAAARSGCAALPESTAAAASPMARSNSAASPP